IGDHQVEVLHAAPVGGGRGGGEGFGVRGDEVARGVLQQRPGHAVLQRVGQLDVADRTFDLLHVGSHALVAFAADAVGPLHRLALADGLLPERADLAQVVGEVEGGAGTVGALDQVDLGGGQCDAGVDRGDGRVVPVPDLAQVDVGQQRTGQ